MTALSYPCRNRATVQPGRISFSFKRLHGCTGRRLRGCTVAEGAHSFERGGVCCSAKKEGKDEAIPVHQATGSGRKNSRRLVRHF